MVLKQLDKNVDFIGKYDDTNTKEKLKSYLINNLPLNKKIVVLCVGSDRSTGDSLGPLVGSFLTGDCYISHENIEIWGTLENPLHAKNINKITKKIKNDNTDDVCVIVIDACLDTYDSVGSIRVSQGPTQPNSWIKKNISKVGDFYINMVVNVRGYREFQVLQSTKLSVVLKGADLIADAITEALSNLKVENKLQ